MFETEDGVVAVDMAANTAEFVSSATNIPTTAPHRSLLFMLIRGALRSEAGVRSRQAQREKTDYYAGRRAGFITSAAHLMAELYSGDFEAAETALKQAVHTAGTAVLTQELADEAAGLEMARIIAERVLHVI
jgi:hypothetical protein